MRREKGPPKSFPWLQPPERVGSIFNVSAGPDGLARGDRIPCFSIRNSLIEKAGPQKLCSDTPAPILMRGCPSIHRPRQGIGRQNPREGIALALPVRWYRSMVHPSPDRPDPMRARTVLALASCGDRRPQLYPSRPFHYSYHPISRGSQRAISGNMMRTPNPKSCRATNGTMPR